jgi:hypothetical protein
MDDARRTTPVYLVSRLFELGRGTGVSSQCRYTGDKIKTVFIIFVRQAKDRYGEADLNKYCLFNYGNETLNSYSRDGNWEGAFGERLDGL